jgi:hypothetical protein
MSKDGFTFQGTGKIDRVDTFVSKAGKEIITLVFKIDGQYPAFIPIKFFGRLADEAKSFKAGDIVEVTGELGGRDWNGKVYGDIVGRTVECVAAGAKAESAPPADGDPLDLPF